MSESRPNTAQTPVSVDPLALEVEDLYARYKVMHLNSLCSTSYH